MTRLLLLTLLLIAGPALSQAPADIIVRPTTAISPTPVLTTAAAAGQALTNCLVPEGADFLDTTTHFQCVSTSPGGISDHTITIVEGGGHVTVRAVTVRTEINGTITVSNASPNFKQVLDVPPAPTILSRFLGWVRGALA